MAKIKVDNMSSVKKALDLTATTGNPFSKQKTETISTLQNNEAIARLSDPLKFERDKAIAANRISIEDNRLVDAITNKKLTKKAPLVADKDFIKNVVSAAKRNGIDPYTALAMAYQETNMGDGWKDNPFHMSRIQTEDPLEESMLFLKEKYELAKRLGKKNEADIIQAWNGYGKITPKSEYKTNMYYGIDVSKNPIDMNTNPVYGKRILDIRDNILKKNKNIINIVNSTK
jgi:hypothetical protein